MNHAQRLRRISMLGAAKLMAFMRGEIVGTRYIIRMKRATHQPPPFRTSPDFSTKSVHFIYQSMCQVLISLRISVAKADEEMQQP
ncbi:MAG: hypothetical protein CMR00_00740 [[Chlorobium] sp. 445]|nr:MAG: hypothetical protein CMR00_00740 [[Chlorobium] sp. 445]